MSVYGFKNDKCKVEVPTREEFEEYVSKVLTQSLAYTNTSDGVYINVNFKRSGNIVECIVIAKLAGGAIHTRTSSEFFGNFPSWAKPDMNFSKQHIHFGDNEYKGGLSMLIYKDGRFTVLYNNLYETETTFLLQFTYIIDNARLYDIGDVDGNGTVDETDLRLLQNHIMGVSLSDSQLSAADMNGDGQVSASDYVLLKNMLGIE